MKKVILILLTGSLLTCLFLLNPFESKAKIKSKTSFQKLAKPKSEDSLITIVAVGDMMLGTNFPDPSFLPAPELFLLEPMYSFLQNADLTFGNLEGTILNEGGEVKKCSDPTKCYAFRQPEYFVDQYKLAGFDILSLANNHMGDFGNAGRTNSQRILKEKNIHFAGLDDCPWDTVTINGITYGFTAFAPNNFCLQITDYNKLEEIVSLLNQISDIVIVSFHGGAEGASKTHVTRKTEIFFEENRGNVYEFANKAIDAGADLVLGLSVIHI
jgi:poly-gamma-glutamate capsule biosynthesis protein CapA/YwtB (metallophosphatase superfamily)